MNHVTWDVVVRFPLFLWQQGPSSAQLTIARVRRIRAFSRNTTREQCSYGITGK
ncbi:hypothetical protein AMATHDRAFT_69817 [Amanita thiersii Skay4041]|uniref:Uncharacterized protein n=1 Tax=Amanita thiersii Skay4041 TaxID=703135 RepID=A0A2A9N849_9AGAR|nr:hypothetical protein AMATHDRAFT_69817 [Amanita thiersii Skay4041]